MPYTPQQIDWESMRKAHTEIDRLKAENENLKAELENRDLNLEHFRSIIKRIESRLDEKRAVEGIRLLILMQFYHGGYDNYLD